MHNDTATYWKHVAFNYVKSMRLYYAFITGISGWLGVAFYQFLFPGSVSPLRAALVLTLLFLSWGVNQIINDFLGLKEDRINAPNRPLVTGALPLRPALVITGVCIAVTLVAAWMLNPLSVIPALAGILLNALYEYAKRFSLWGNIVFGVMIAMCPIFGFLASGPTPDPLFTSNRLSGIVLVALLNAVMTFYTYFKDYEGDKKAKVVTFVVKHGITKASIAGLAFAFLFVLCCAALVFGEALPLQDIIFQEEFLFICAVTLFLQVWTGWLFFRDPVGSRTYFNLVVNIQACTAGNCALLAIFNARLALYLLVVSYILIEFFFTLYRDSQS
jgi:4-hydroxybenzoate polyprenyltransferase and related prenyltransferases